MSEDISTLASRLARRLVRAGATMSAAESCTGGLLTSTMTDITGASRCFNQSWVTYSNEAKIIELGVKPPVLEENGAVSAEVAIQMAQGARDKAGSDVAISITGIAGPRSDDSRKKVGEVYVGIATSQYEGAEYKLFSGDRGQNKLNFVGFALRKTIEIWDKFHARKRNEEMDDEEQVADIGELISEDADEELYDEAGELMSDDVEPEWVTPISEDWSNEVPEREPEESEEVVERGMDDIEWASSEEQ